MPEFLKYHGVDGEVRGPSSPKADGTSNTVMIAEQNPALGGPDTFALGGPDTFSLGGPDTFALGGPDTFALGGPDTFSLGGPDTFALGGPDTSSLGGPDTFGQNSGRQHVSTDGGYVLISVSHTATLNAPETDWLVS